MKILSALSTIAFQTVKFCDDWFGLPSKVADSIHFRREWRNGFSAKLRTPSLWIHGASVGELEDLASFFTNEESLNAVGHSLSSVVLTASSISTRDKLKRWKEQYHFGYAGPLPPEDPVELDEFLEKISPDVMLISQSDMWPLCVEKANNKLKTGILWLPSRDSSAKIIAPLCLLPQKTMIGTRASDSHPLSGIFQSSFVGNLRMDRILNRIQAARISPDHALDPAGAAPDPQKTSIIIGSAWAHDAAFWERALNELNSDEVARLQVVVIPHETRESVQAASIQGILPRARVLSIDGILLEAYKGFSAAFVGGAFKTGLHSVMEPALWGIPVFCGPDISKQPEAKKLSAMGLLHPLSRPEELTLWLKELVNANARDRVNKEAQRLAVELAKERGAGLRLRDLIKKFQTKQAADHS